MFLENKYTKWYYLIIENAKSRDTEFMGEIHHIMPRCFGGGDNEENLVKLTFREHYVCHWLLTKMTEGQNRCKMTFSLHTFFHFNGHRRLNFRSRQYEYHKKMFREACYQRTPSTKDDVFLFKHILTGEEHIGTRNSFHKHSGLTPQEVNWLVNYCINPDEPKKVIKKWGIWIESLGIFSYDKPRPPPGILNLGDVTCEHCNKTISLGNYKRWHGDRCKLIDESGHYERTRQVAGINKN